MPEAAEYPKQIDMIEVPHYYQLDPTVVGDEPEARTVCSVVAMKSLIDYYELLQGEPAMPFAELKQLMEEWGGRLEGSSLWRHDAQVNTLKALGLTAWRRNWEAPSQDPAYFAESEGYDESQLSRVQGQISSEMGLEPRQAAKKALIEAIRAGAPVIVSVKPGFTHNKDSHQVVLHGWETSPAGDTLHIEDPIVPAEEQAELGTITEDYFFDHFNYRAIFATPEIHE